MYFVYSTSKKFSKAASDRISAAIAEIDPSASFCGPLKIPGSTTTGWIERPNDGTNDYNSVRSCNRQMADIARKEIEGE